MAAALSQEDYRVMVLRSAPLPVNSACRSHCPASALQAPPPQTRRLEQHSEQSTGRLCLSPLTRAGLTARVPQQLLPPLPTMRSWPRACLGRAVGRAAGFPGPCPVSPCALAVAPLPMASQPSQARELPPCLADPPVTEKWSHSCSMCSGRRPELARAVFAML